MAAIHSTQPGARRRRWVLVSVVCALLAISYVLALRWVTLRVENDINRAIHPVPAILVDHQRRAD
jgi:hypothetical protein